MEREKKNMKKLYQIIKAKCIVSRKGGIKEMETFSFLYDLSYILTFHIDTLLKDDYLILLKKQIDFYNEFCPEDYVILNFENEEFEQVGEIWL